MQLRGLDSGASRTGRRLSKWCGESAVTDCERNVRCLNPQTSIRAAETRSCTWGSFCLRVDRELTTLDSLKKKKNVWNEKHVFWWFRSDRGLPEVQRKNVRLWLILHRGAVRWTRCIIWGVIVLETNVNRLIKLTGEMMTFLSVGSKRLIE